MKIKLSLIVIVFLSMISCQQMIDKYREKEAQENYVSPYKEIYAGTYEGSDKGMLRIDISRKNTVIVTRISTQYPLIGGFYGGMIEASFNKVKSRTSGFTILGNVINNPQNTFTGTWKINDGNSGSWTLKKQ